MSRAMSAESVFQAIASPARRALLDALAPGPRNVTQLVAVLEVTQSAVSQQLALLRGAGLVEERAEGRFRWYQLNPAPLGEVDGWLGRYRALMERQLDALGRALDAVPDTPAERAARAPRGRPARAAPQRSRPSR